MRITLGVTGGVAAYKGRGIGPPPSTKRVTPFKLS